MYIGILCGIVAKLTSEIVLFLCFEKSGFLAPGWCLFYETTLVVFFFVLWVSLEFQWNVNVLKNLIINYMVAKSLKGRY